MNMINDLLRGAKLSKAAGSHEELARGDDG
jgi:hypothetical protein